MSTGGSFGRFAAGDLPAMEVRRRGAARSRGRHGDRHRGRVRDRNDISSGLASPNQFLLELVAFIYLLKHSWAFLPKMLISSISGGFPMIHFDINWKHRTSNQQNWSISFLSLSLLCSARYYSPSTELLENVTSAALEETNHAIGENWKYLCERSEKPKT